MTNLSGANLNNDAAVGPQGEGRESPSSFPKYPAYKDSGVEWLGDVPEGWSVASLRFFADLITGITPPSDDLSNYAEEGWSWIRPEDLDDSGKPVLASKFLTDQGLAFCRKVKGQSTLICCIGTIGKLGFIETDACTNQQITAVVPRQGGRFYFYAMHALKPAFDAYATGNVLRILNSERLGSVEVAVPIKSEAESIARFLDHETARIDALIEEQQRLIELLKEKHQALISYVVTKGLDPTVTMKGSGVDWLGEVPAHWIISPLKFLGELVTGITPPSQDLDNYSDEESWPWVRPDDLKDKVSPVHASKFLTDQGWEYCRPVSPGSTLVCCIGTIGKLGYLENIASTNQQITAVIPFDNAAPRFLFYILYAAKAELNETATGNVLKILNSERLGNVSVVAPPIIEQVQIAAFLDQETSKLDTLLAEAGAGIKLLGERRSALISAAVTGKIDVRGWQPPASTQAPKLEVAEAV